MEMTENDKFLFLIAKLNCHMQLYETSVTQN